MSVCLFVCVFFILFFRWPYGMVLQKLSPFCRWWGQYVSMPWPDEVDTSMFSCYFTISINLWPSLYIYSRFIFIKLFFNGWVAMHLNAAFSEKDKKERDLHTKKTVVRVFNHNLFQILVGFPTSRTAFIIVLLQLLQ